MAALPTKFVLLIVAADTANAPPSALPPAPPIARFAVKVTVLEQLTFGDEELDETPADCALVVSLKPKLPPLSMAFMIVAVNAPTAPPNASPPAPPSPPLTGSPLPPAPPCAPLRLKIDLPVIVTLALVTIAPPSAGPPLPAVLSA